MKSFIAIAVVLCAVCLLGGERSSVSASPLPEYEEAYALGEYPGAGYAADELSGAPLLRQKRATCDLLSGFGVGHSLCAAHCIGHGNRGGYCDSRGVCRCR